MEFGAHLPLIGWNQRSLPLSDVVKYAETAERLGFGTLCANDHLRFSRPWLDGLTALAVVIPHTRRIRLATTVTLPFISGQVSLAKTLAAIDLLSDGRLIVGVSAGSSAYDYVAVGIPFEERWKRFEESVAVLRALWQKGASAFKGQFYSTEGIVLEPYPLQQPSPPIWIGSWGSEAGLKRTARLGDGWLASAYNTTPKQVSEGWTALKERLQQIGKNADHYPNAIASGFCYITEDNAKAERIIQEVLSPTLNRPADELRERLLVGSAQECAEKLSAYEATGAQRFFIWPIANEVRQLDILQERVVPLVK